MPAKRTADTPRAKRVKPARIHKSAIAELAFKTGAGKLKGDALCAMRDYAELLVAELVEESEAAAKFAKRKRVVHADDVRRVLEVRGTVVV